MPAVKSMQKTVFLVFLLAGCSGVPTIPNVTPYKIDIQQGNYVTQDMVAKLKPGMSRAQVRFVLGTPLVADVFHADRWDYVYLYQKAGQVTEHRRMTVIFRDDKLVRLEGDVVPAKPKSAAETKPKPSPNASSPKPAESAPPRKSEATAVPAKPEGATLTTTSGDPVAAGAKEADSGNSKSQAEKSTEKPRKDGAAAEEEKGFFGRMFEKLGF